MHEKATEDSLDNVERGMTMKRAALVTSCSLLLLFAGTALAQKHDEKPHGVMKKETATPTTVTPGEGEQAIAMKDGSQVIIRKDGSMYHADANGKRMLMKNGVVMESKDGEKFMMRNDVLWKQITEKGTMHPGHQ